MAIRFTPRQVNHGFDRSTSPKWQMVPVGGTRTLTVHGAAGLVPRVVNPDPANPALTIATVAAGRDVRLTLTGGLVAGHAIVEWVPSAAFVGPATNDFSLDVSVKAEKQVQTAFHYVDDGHRQKTTRRIADLDPLIAKVNAILGPQANVTIIRKSAAALPVAQNLGDVVRFSSHLQGPPDNVAPAQHEWDVLKALGDATADFNVFFVVEYEQDNTPYHDDADAGTIAADKMCIFEDNVGNDTATTFAHETVHNLGIPGHDASNRHLMATGRNGLGRFITRDQANTINPSGT
jgi:hypothetical protein